jgi:ABC-type ATPase involved in cell division
MIELEAVTVRYGRRGEIVALEEVDLVVGAGELLVVTGPSGAGKTTLLGLMGGALSPTAGVVRLFGHDVARLRRSSLPLLRRRVGVVYQDLMLLPDRSALDNVGLPLEVMALPRAEIRARAAAALARVGLSWTVDAAVGRLSIGEQARVAIARAVVGEPAIVLCDEPTGNLDRGHSEDLLWQLGELADAGTTVVLTTNDTDVIDAARRHRWRGVELDGGRLVARPPDADAARDTAPNVVPFPLALAGGHE